MIPKILLIRSFIQAVDKILKQFACSIGGNLVAYVDSDFVQKIPTALHSMKYKGNIIQTEGFFVIIAV